MSTSIGRIPATLALVVGAVVALSACAPISNDGGASSGASGASGASDASGASGGAPATTNLSIATGGTGGVYYPLGNGLATVIRQNLDGYDAAIQETNASVDNMLLINDGGADIAFSLGDTAADAVAGVGEDFEGSPVSACALGRIYNNYTQLVASADAGISSVEDLVGKRVSLGAPGSGTEVIALRILAAAGIDPDADIERQQLSIDETVGGLRDGTIDAGFWSGGLPTGALVDYATTGDMVLVPTGEYATAMQEAHGAYYLEATIPGGTYEGIDEEIPTVVVPNVLVVNPDRMNEALQTELTRLLFDQKQALVDTHPAAEELDPETAADVPFMDVCPGSQAYYDE